MNMISAVIVTFNEEKKLEDCLKSIYKKVDEIIIVDLGSTDKSLQIASKYEAKVFKHENVDYVEKVRDFSISKANGEWILVLDPDERITHSLFEKLKEIISEGKYTAVNIPRKNIFFGRWIRHTNWWPDRQIRFFKKGKVSWSSKIHSYPKVYGLSLELISRPELSITHYGYDNIQQFIDRQNRYSSIEAENRFNLGERFSFFKLGWFPLREFIVRFIRHGGYLDGKYGFILTYLMMVYQLMVMIKIWELRKRGK